MGGGQAGIEFQGVPQHELREGPLAPVFQGHAEVVEARCEAGIVLHQPMQDRNGPGSDVAVIVPHPVPVHQHDAHIVVDGGRFRADLQSLFVVIPCRGRSTSRTSIRAVQRQGQRKVRPELVGILLPDAYQKANPVPPGCGQAFAERQQQR